jgi:hypothetical protein
VKECAVCFAGVSIEVAGVVLGILGLLASIIAIPLGFIEGNKQINRMGDVRDKLQTAIAELKGEVETHHIGAFPEFLPEIIEILDAADKSITIFCDLPAYGVVSSSERFEEYAKVIERQAKNPRVEVRMLHLDEAGRAASLGIQFRGSWEVLRKKPAVDSFVATATETLDEQNPKQSFLALVEARQVETLERFEGADVVADPTDLIMPLYFWIVDNSKAIFALTEFSPQAHEAGFRTGSKNLITAMNGIYVRYRDSGTAESRGGEAPAAITDAI